MTVKVRPMGNGHSAYIARDYRLKEYKMPEYKSDAPIEQAMVAPCGKPVFGFFSKWKDGTIGYVESTSPVVLDGGYWPYQKRQMDKPVPTIAKWIAAPQPPRSPMRSPRSSRSPRP